MGSESSRFVKAEIAMYRATRQFFVLTFALLLGSCAGTTAGRAGPTRTSGDIITQEQLHRFSDAYQAIHALHPTWLRARGADSFRNPSQVWVYRDGTRLGGVETLRATHTGDIAEIRFYDAMSATQRWGTGHAAGVISITTRSR